MPEESDLSSTVKSSMHDIMDETAKILERINNLAEKGPITLMFSVGTLILLLGLLFKIDIRGFHMSNIGLGEFIAILTVGMILILAAASIKFLQFYITTVSILKEQQKLGGELLKKTLDTVSNLSQAKPSADVLK